MCKTRPGEKARIVQMHAQQAQEAGCDGAIPCKRLANGRLKKLVGLPWWKSASVAWQFNGKSVGVRGAQANVGSMERSDSAM